MRIPSLLLSTSVIVSSIHVAPTRSELTGIGSVTPERLSRKLPTSFKITDYDARLEARPIAAVDELRGVYSERSIRAQLGAQRSAYRTAQRSRRLGEEQREVARANREQVERSLAYLRETAHSPISGKGPGRRLREAVSRCLGLSGKCPAHAPPTWAFSEGGVAAEKTKFHAPMDATGGEERMPLLAHDSLRAP